MMMIAMMITMVHPVVLMEVVAHMVKANTTANEVPMIAALLDPHVSKVSISPYITLSNPTFE